MPLPALEKEEEAACVPPSPSAEQGPAWRHRGLSPPFSTPPYPSSGRPALPGLHMMQCVAVKGMPLVRSGPVGTLDPPS